jgi:hypothetical protein
MSRSTMIVFIIGILLLIYGYLCRLLSIYFFWDSKYFGWLGIVSGVLLFLIDIRIARVRQKQNIFFVRAMVAAIVIFLALEGSAIVWLKTSAAYNDLKTSINTDQSLKAEIGSIRGYGLIPGIDIIDLIKAPSSESLPFRITVRGQNAYKEFDFTIERTLPMNWRVTSGQPVN